MSSGREAPRSQMILQSNWSEKRMGTSQTDTIFTLKTEGENDVILGKEVKISHYLPAGPSDPVRLEKWQITADQLIAFITKNGQKIS